MTSGQPSPSLTANPVLGTWLSIGSDGVVEVRSGKVELGQGVLTALAQIVAEELDVDVSRIQMTAATTGRSPDEGYTAGSLSIQHSGSALRAVSAEVRELYLAVAAEKLALPVEDLDVHDGRITAPDGSELTYWDLANDVPLDRPASGTAATKSPDVYRVVGSNVPRIDLSDKLTGVRRYVHDLSPTGMLYARVVRPPSRGARLRGVDPSPTRSIPGVVCVVRDGSFLAVVAEREEVALRAAERLRRDADWGERPTLPDEDDLPGYLIRAPAQTSVLAEHSVATEPVVAQSNSSTYHRPFIAHGSIGPSCAVAHSIDDRLQVWTHAQGIYLLRREIALAVNLPAEHVVVNHVEGAGCYGHNGADDAAMDAALIALAVPGRPVQVLWSRQDELGWSPLGSAGVVTVSADVDDGGDVVAWRHEIWSGSYMGRPGLTPTTPFLAVSDRDAEQIRAGGEPPLANGGGTGRNAVPGYDFPSLKVVNNLLTELPLRTSALRSLGGFLNVFAAESFMDELAAACGRDPVEYRLAHLSDPRGRAVVDAAARRSDWPGWTPSDSRGRGIAYARYKNSSAYCAVVAEVEAVESLRVRKLTIAVDAGLIISPDGAANQIEGGAIQATSWTLKERVRFDRRTVTSDTWESYPILRFAEVPDVEVEFLPSTGNASLGVGECVQGPAAAAIANALYDALGLRVRTLPLTPANIVAAMQADDSNDPCRRAPR
jgi:CO/xanthine dehydrogenase Mo-binding subunit